MVTSPQDHWMKRKGKILKFEGKMTERSLDQSEEFFGRKLAVFKKKIQRKTKVFEAEVSQPKKRDRKTVIRWLRARSGVCVRWGGGEGRPLIDVELVFEVEEQTRRLASETAH